MKRTVRTGKPARKPASRPIALVECREEQVHRPSSARFKAVYVRSGSDVAVRFASGEGPLSRGRLSRAARPLPATTGQLGTHVGHPVLFSGTPQADMWAGVPSNEAGRRVGLQRGGRQGRWESVAVRGLALRSNGRGKLSRGQHDCFRSPPATFDHRAAERISSGTPAAWPRPVPRGHRGRRACRSRPCRAASHGRALCRRSR